MKKKNEKKMKNGNANHCYCRQSFFCSHLHNLNVRRGQQTGFSSVFLMKIYYSMIYRLHCLRVIHRPWLCLSRNQPFGQAHPRSHFLGTHFCL